LDSVGGNFHGQKFFPFKSNFGKQFLKENKNFWYIKFPPSEKKEIQTFYNEKLESWSTR